LIEGYHFLDFWPKKLFPIKNNRINTRSDVTHSDIYTDKEKQHKYWRRKTNNVVNTSCKDCQSLIKAWPDNITKTDTISLFITTLKKIIHGYGFYIQKSKVDYIFTLIKLCIPILFLFCRRQCKTVWFAVLLHLGCTQGRHLNRAKL